jgi:CheY-like chemotaxis protein
MANELILIVEDNPKNLKLVRDTLQVKGYKPSRPRRAKRACASRTSAIQRLS